MWRLWPTGGLLSQKEEGKEGTKLELGIRSSSADKTLRIVD
jgi:hypothetical protein